MAIVNVPKTFIKLTEVDMQGEVHIDIDRIIYMGLDTNMQCTDIGLEHDCIVHVVETPEEIFNIINSAYAEDVEEK